MKYCPECGEDISKYLSIAVFDRVKKIQGADPLENVDKAKLPKEFFNLIIQSILLEVGYSALEDIVEYLRTIHAFQHKEYYSRLKRYIKNKMELKPGVFKGEIK